MAVGAGAAAPTGAGWKGLVVIQLAVGGDASGALETMIHISK